MHWCAYQLKNAAVCCWSRKEASWKLVSSRTSPNIFDEVAELTRCGAVTTTQRPNTKGGFNPFCKGLGIYCNGFWGCGPLGPHKYPVSFFRSYERRMKQKKGSGKTRERPQQDNKLNMTKIESLKYIILHEFNSALFVSLFLVFGIDPSFTGSGHNNHLKVFNMINKGIFMILWGAWFMIHFESSNMHS